MRRPVVDRAARGPATPWAPWRRAVAFTGGAALAILVLYLVHPVAGGHRLPIGPDGPVYTWWTRYAEVAGLGVVPGRPGVPGAALALGAILGTDAVQTVALLGPALATACGLAGAALVETALGPDPLRAGAAALLVGAFSAYLAAGWLANLGLVALFLGALAAFALAGRSWRAVAAGAALLAAAGLAHRTFLVAASAILAGVIASYVPAALREHRGGGRLRHTMAARLAAGTAIGAAGSLLGLAAVRGTPLAVDTSQDGFLRRLGLRDLLRDRHTERLADDARRAAPHLVASVGLGGAWRLWRSPDAEPPYLWSAVVAWATLTVLGLVVLPLTGRWPAYRLLAFAFFLPLAGAAGLVVVARKRFSWRVAAVLAGAVFLGGAMYGWYRQEPFVDARELRVADTAGRWMEGLPRGTAVIVLVDTRELASSFWVTRFGNVIRMAVPADRIPDVRLAVGLPEDFLAGRPTITGDREHDRLSDDYLGETRDVRGRAPVLVLRPFNLPGYAQARALGTEVAPEVAVLRGPSAPVTLAGDDAGLGAPALVGLSIASLALLGALGGGWARWALPGGHPRAVVALALSAGLGVLILAAVAADGLGLNPGGGGAGGAALLGAGGYLAGLRRRGKVLSQ